MFSHDVCSLAIFGSKAILRPTLENNPFRLCEIIVLLATDSQLRPLSNHDFPSNAPWF